MIQKAMAPLALATALALCAALSGCGHSDSAADAASSDSVEMPAEQALSGIVATPAADASAAAPDAVSSGCAVSIPRGLLLQLLLAHVGDLGGKDAGHREVLRRKPG